MFPQIENPDILNFLSEQEKKLMGENVSDVLNVYPKSGEKEREIQKQEIINMLPGLNNVLALEPLLEAPEIFDKPSTEISEEDMAAFPELLPYYRELRTVHEDSMARGSENSPTTTMDRINPYRANSLTKLSLFSHNVLELYPPFARGVVGENWDTINNKLGMLDKIISEKKYSDEHEKITFTEAKLGFNIARLMKQAMLSAANEFEDDPNIETLLKNEGTETLSKEEVARILEEIKSSEIQEVYDKMFSPDEQ